MIVSKDSHSTKEKIKGWLLEYYADNKEKFATLHRYKEYQPFSIEALIGLTTFTLDNQEEIVVSNEQAESLLLMAEFDTEHPYSKVALEVIKMVIYFYASNGRPIPLIWKSIHADLILGIKIVKIKKRRADADYRIFFTHLILEELRENFPDVSQKEAIEQIRTVYLDTESKHLFTHMNAEEDTLRRQLNKFKNDRKKFIKGFADSHP
jgi:hypothetical protein